MAALLRRQQLPDSAVAHVCVPLCRKQVLSSTFELLKKDGHVPRASTQVNFNFVCMLRVAHLTLVVEDQVHLGSSVVLHHKRDLFTPKHMGEDITRFRAAYTFHDVFGQQFADCEEGRGCRWRGVRSSARASR